jgi:hypothetical protein
MSDRPWWKKPPKPTTSDVILERKAYLEATDQEVRTWNRKDLRGRGTPRSKIFSMKMAIPKKKK